MIILFQYIVDKEY